MSEPRVLQLAFPPKEGISRPFRLSVPVIFRAIGNIPFYLKLFDEHEELIGQTTVSASGQMETVRKWHVVSVPITCRRPNLSLCTLYVAPVDTDRAPPGSGSQHKRCPVVVRTS